MKNGLLLKEINSLYLKDHFFRVNVIARRKRGADDAAIHCMQWARTDNTVRSLVHSGSPRAYPLAMTRSGEDAVCG